MQCALIVTLLIPHLPHAKCNYLDSLEPWNPFCKVRLLSSSDHHRTFCCSCFDLPLSWWTPRHCGGGNWLYHPIYCILRNTILCWRCIISQYSSTLSKRVTTGPEQTNVLCNSSWRSLRLAGSLGALSQFTLPDSHVPPACPAVLPRLSRHTKKTTFSHMLNHCRMLAGLNRSQGNDSLLQLFLQVFC